MLLYRGFFSESSLRPSDFVKDGANHAAQRLNDAVSSHGLVACVKAAQQILDLLSDNLTHAEISAVWHV
jgi:hypothetical protein